METVSGIRGKSKKVRSNFKSADVNFDCETCTRKTRNMQPNSSGNGELVCTNGCYQEWLGKSRVTSLARQSAA